MRGMCAPDCAKLCSRSAYLISRARPPSMPRSSRRYRRRRHRSARLRRARARRSVRASRAAADRQMIRIVFSPAMVPRTSGQVLLRRSPRRSAERRSAACEGRSARRRRRSARRAEVRACPATAYRHRREPSRAARTARRPSSDARTDAKVAQVARQRRLGDVQPARQEELPQLLLAGHRRDSPTSSRIACCRSCFLVIAPP